MKKIIPLILVTLFFIGCRTTPQKDDSLVKLATSLAEPSSPEPPPKKPFTLMPTAVVRTLEGPEFKVMQLPPDPWTPVKTQIGLIADKDGAVRIDFTPSLKPPITWETWFYLTNWSKVLICDEHGGSQGFYRVIHLPEI